jgi:SAM-dependent methyltransferase
VDVWFSAHASDWQEIYARHDVWAVVHQHRLRLALDWIDRLGLAPGSRVLDVGCGSGVTATALARRGLDVVATDSVAPMLRLARSRGAVEVARSDAHALPFTTGTFDLVVALGVLPWLHSPGCALEEMARVARPGGYVLANVDNLWRLTDLLDPRLNPLLRRPRRVLRRALLGARSGVHDKSHTIREFDNLLHGCGLHRELAACFGFGPFTFLGRDILPPRTGVSVDRALQACADRRVPLLRSTGAAYMVLARTAVYAASRS